MNCSERLRKCIEKLKEIGKDPNLHLTEKQKVAWHMGYEVAIELIETEMLEWNGLNE